jgi:nucleotide-binding universal stress UspA family protein
LFLPEYADLSLACVSLTGITKTSLQRIEEPEMLPPRSILTAVDFSEQSRGALIFAARLAKQCGAALHVLYAEESLMVAAAAEGGFNLSADTHAELSRFIDAAAPARACAPTVIVNAGDPVTVILHAACRQGADLIVVGARGMSGAGRLLFGSVTEGVLLRADRSVLIVPDWWAALASPSDGLAGVGPLVVGVDFSESSLLALKAACALATCLQTTVEAVHVVEDLHVPERWKAHAERVVGERVNLARHDLAVFLGGVDSPTAVLSRVETGSVVERLTEAAAVIGTRSPVLVLGRHGPRSHSTPGATAYRIASMTRVPVLMHKDARS